MRQFSGNPSDLESAIAYELQALEFLRSTLFNDSECSNRETEVLLGDYAENGELRQKVNLSLVENLSDEAVKQALETFRPLAFVATYKLQDMIAEWILRENGKNDWKFEIKIRNYKSLKENNTLIEPRYFSDRPEISHAFWILYEKFKNYRGTIIHAGGISLLNDGSLQITPTRHPPLLLNYSQQAAYIRAICIIAKQLIGSVATNEHLDAIVESSLYKLSDVHGVTAIREHLVRLDRLKVIVPPGQLLTSDPISVSIDWDKLRTMMRENYMMLSPDIEVFFPVVIEIPREDEVIRWSFPLEDVPVGITNLVVGDQQFDSFICHEER